MSTASPPERYCSRCERRCGAEIEACAAAGQGCAYVPSSLPPEAVPPAVSTTRDLVGTGLLAVIIFGPSLLAVPLIVTTRSLWWLVPIGISAIAFFSLLAQRHTTQRLFREKTSGARLWAINWVQAEHGAAHRLESAPEAVSLALAPLDLPEPVSIVARIALLRDYRQPEQTGREEAVGIGQHVLLELVARGELSLQRRRSYTAYGKRALRDQGDVYELVRAKAPAGAQPGALENRLLTPFTSLPPGTPLTAEALTRGLYDHRQVHPSTRLAELAGQPLQPVNTAQISEYRTLLERHLAEVSAQTPDLLTSWAAEIKRAIESQRELNDN